MDFWRGIRFLVVASTPVVCRSWFPGLAKSFCQARTVERLTVSDGVPGTGSAFGVVSSTVLGHGNLCHIQHSWSQISWVGVVSAVCETMVAALQVPVSERLGGRCTLVAPSMGVKLLACQALFPAASD